MINKHSNFEGSFAERLLSDERVGAIPCDSFEEAVAVAESIAETLGKMTEARAALFSTAMNAISLSVDSKLKVQCLQALDAYGAAENGLEESGSTVIANWSSGKERCTVVSRMAALTV